MLVVVRHGETAANAGSRFQGRIDTELSARGRAQVELLGSALSQPPDRVVSSPLQRALDTAKAFGCPVEVDERWLEMDYGRWEGVELAAVRDEAEWIERGRRADWSPPGGESLRSVGERVRAACEDLVEQACRSTVVVVTHVSPVKAAVAWALGVGDTVAWRLFVDVASVTTIEIRESAPVLVSFNDTSHLRGR